MKSASLELIPDCETKKCAFSLREPGLHNLKRFERSGDENRRSLLGISRGEPIYALTVDIPFNLSAKIILSSNKGCIT